MKSSDAELHRSAQAEAAKHGATFLGPAPTYKYGLFRLADGREVEIHLYHVREGKWPKDIDQFLARQSLSRGRNQDKMLARLQALAYAAGARMLDPQWQGPHHWYCFAIPDGREVKIRGSKLVTSGWPKDIDVYLEWSKARCQTESIPKTKPELFEEFKAAVKSHGAVVLSPTWLGARTPHAILLSDGTVRNLKPNQLKYFGWPAVPLDELRKMAAPYPVHILPDTADKETQVFRIMVSGGLYLEGSFADLKTWWSEGAHNLISEAAQWAAREGLQLALAKWQGVLAEYELLTADGASVWRRLPAAAAHEAKRQNDAEIAKLRRVGTMHGARLLSSTFEGRDAAYVWEREGKVVTATARALIEHSRNRARFKALVSRANELGLGAELISTEWAGMCGSYQWRLANGSEVTAKLSQLRLLSRKQAGIDSAAPASRNVEAQVFQTGAGEQALEILRDWADGVGIRLLSTDWVDPGASYEWALPDGTIVAASLKKVRNCTRAVLRQRTFGEVDVPPEESLLTKEDCSTLRERIAQSRSR